MKPVLHYNICTIVTGEKNERRKKWAGQCKQKPNLV